MANGQERAREYLACLCDKSDGYMDPKLTPPQEFSRKKKYYLSDLGSPWNVVEGRPLIVLGLPRLSSAGDIRVRAYTGACNDPDIIQC